MQIWQLLKTSRHFFGHYVPILVLFSASMMLPSCSINQPAKPFSSEALPTEAIAEISEIRSYPVRVKYINSTSARPATVGAPLKVNESVSTEDSSTAQVTLKNGAIIRIGGNSNLTLKTQNQVEITSGRMVAWAAKERKAPAQIATPFGEISSNDGTLYLEIPPKAADDRRIIALDGTVTVLLKSTSEIVTIGKGEEIRIKADGKATAPKRIDKENIDKNIANNSLLFGFSSQLASLPQITAEFGVAATVKEANKIQFRRADLPSKPNENSNQNKVTYTSGAANNDRRDDQGDRRREDTTAAKGNEPPVVTKPIETAPATTSAPISAPPATSEPTPITNNPAPQPQPLTPAPQQPAPLEPPPQPVQPEILSPEPPPVAPKPKN